MSMSPDPVYRDHAFDSYEIFMWDDFRYRVRRTHTRAAADTHDYLTRGEGGEFLWKPYVASAATWDSVQGGAISLIHCLNRQGVTG